MSSFVGRTGTNNDKVVHITSTTETVSTMQNGPLNTSVFHSSLNTIRVVEEFELSTTVYVNNYFSAGYLGALCYIDLSQLTLMQNNIYNIRVETTAELVTSPSFYVDSAPYYVNPYPSNIVITEIQDSFGQFYTSNKKDYVNRGTFTYTFYDNATVTSLTDSSTGATAYPEPRHYLQIADKIKIPGTSTFADYGYVYSGLLNMSTNNLYYANLQDVIKVTVQILNIDSNGNITTNIDNTLPISMSKAAFTVGGQDIFTTKSVVTVDTDDRTLYPGDAATYKANVLAVDPDHRIQNEWDVQYTDYQISPSSLLGSGKNYSFLIQEEPCLVRYYTAVPSNVTIVNIYSTLTSSYYDEDIRQRYELHYMSRFEVLEVLNTSSTTYDSIDVNLDNGSIGRKKDGFIDYFCNVDINQNGIVLADQVVSSYVIPSYTTENYSSSQVEYSPVYSNYTNYYWDYSYLLISTEVYYSSVPSATLKTTIVVFSLYDTNNDLAAARVVPVAAGNKVDAFYQSDASSVITKFSVENTGSLIKVYREVVGSYTYGVLIESGVAITNYSEYAVKVKML